MSRQTARQVLAVLAFANSAFGSTGCATLGGSTQALRVTSEPSGAHVFVNEADSGRTPLMMKILRDHAPVVLRVKHDSSDAVTQTLARTVRPAALALDLLLVPPAIFAGYVSHATGGGYAGFFGVMEFPVIATGIDLMSGNLWKLRLDSVHVLLPPLARARPQR